jgi:hypothetical protein
LGHGGGEITLAVRIDSAIGKVILEEAVEDVGW